MFDRWVDSYRVGWCSLSGILLVLGFAPFSFAVCGWIALVPAWWVITRSQVARRHPLRWGYLVGLIYFGGTFWWIGHVIGLGIVFLVAYLAIYPALWFLLVARLLPPRKGLPTASVVLRALGAAALWVMLEWWRSWFFTGFDWNELGITQSSSPVYRQLAAYSGVSGISFLLVTVNVLWAEGVLAIAQTARTQRVVRMSGPFAVALFLSAAMFALGWTRLIRPKVTDGRGLAFACIQPNLPPSPFDRSKQPSDAEVLDRTERLTLAAMGGPVIPRLLIWPEAMISEGVFQDRPLTEAVREITQSYDGYFLLGSQDFDLAGGRKLYNAAAFFAPHGETYEEYRKTRLVVGGEYLPFSDVLRRIRDLVGLPFDLHIDFTPGLGPQVFTMQDPPVRFAPFICFEDTLSSVADRAVALRPDFFVTITNDGWYTGVSAEWGVRQHLSHAVFRCIEHDRPMIRCANTGISCVIDTKGTVTHRYTDAAGRDIDVDGIFTGFLALDAPRPTLHEKWGDWIVLLSSIVSVMLGVRLFRPADES